MTPPKDAAKALEDKKKEIERHSEYLAAKRASSVSIPATRVERTTSDSGIDSCMPLSEFLNEDDNSNTVES